MTVHLFDDGDAQREEVFETMSARTQQLAWSLAAHLRAVDDDWRDPFDLLDVDVRSGRTLMCLDNIGLACRFRCFGLQSGETRDVYGRDRWALCEAASVERVPFAPRHFDVVVCRTALPDVATAASALNEFARVLRPGGLLVMDCPVAATPLEAFVSRLRGVKTAEGVSKPAFSAKWLSALVAEHEAFSLTSMRRIRKDSAGQACTHGWRDLSAEIPGHVVHITALRRCDGLPRETLPRMRYKVKLPSSLLSRRDLNRDFHYNRA